jgi:hypothetical protein
MWVFRIERAWAHHPGVTAAGGTDWVDLLTLALGALALWGMLRLIDRWRPSRAPRQSQGKRKS